MSKARSTVSKSSASLRSHLLVSPEMAAKLLSHNTSNFRPINKSKVAEYRSNMERKQWNEHTRESLKFTGTGIKNPGELLDGQHRLIAQVQAGVTLHWWIDWEVPQDSVVYLDSGFDRTVGSKISYVTGYSAPVSSLAAAVFRRVSAWDKGKPEFTSGDRTLTDQDALERVQVDETYLHTASVANKLKVPGAPSAVLATMYHLFFRVDPDAAHEFVTALDEREDGYPKTHPIQVARYRLAKLKRDRDASAKLGRKTRIHNEEAALIIVRCWAAWRKGEEIKNWVTPKSFTPYRKIV